MKTEIIAKMVGILIGLALVFAINGGIIWVVCKIVGWTFAWKWVILFTLAYRVVSSLLK